MAYAIMRHQKVKSWGEVAAMAGHHSRSRATPNANPAVPNRWLVGSGDVVRDVRHIVGDRKLRANGVLAVEVVMTASPNFFRPDAPGVAGAYDADRLRGFEEQALAWLNHTFGASNIASVVTHLDEASPHLHACVVPIDSHTGRLSASKWLDGAKRLSALQDSFAEFCRPLGLSRGIKGSKATHTRVADFYSAVNAAEAPSIDVQVQSPPSMIREPSRDSWAAAESERINAQLRPSVQAMADVAAFARLAQRKQQEAEASAQAAQAELERMRQEAALVRDISLAEVLARAGYAQDSRDNWVGPAGRISVTAQGAKYWNDDLHAGGRNAIDLAMHINGHNFAEAVAWLGREIGRSAAVGAAMAWAKLEAQEAVRARAPAPRPPKPCALPIAIEHHNHLSAPDMDIDAPRAR